MASLAWQMDGPEEDDARRLARRMVTITGASLRAHGEQAEAATLLDLSIYGCRLAAPARHDADARLWLRFDGGLPIGATVVWAKDDELGCRFDEPIANALMRRLTQG